MDNNFIIDGNTFILAAIIFVAICIVYWVGRYVIFCCKKRTKLNMEQLIIPTTGDLNYVITIEKELENECAICLDQFDIGDTARYLKCGHYYHNKCIGEWLGSKTTCPKCTATVV